MTAANNGLADASGVDDSRWSISITRGAPVKGGAVIISIIEATA